jgi:hypothetical protein
MYCHFLLIGRSPLINIYWVKAPIHRSRLRGNHLESAIKAQQYGYQDYYASDPPVCAFKVCSGAQLKDFIKQKEVTDLQIFYN